MMFSIRVKDGIFHQTRRGLKMEYSIRHKKYTAVIMKKIVILSFMLISNMLNN